MQRSTTSTAPHLRMAGALLGLLLALGVAAAPTADAQSLRPLPGISLDTDVVPLTTATQDPTTLEVTSDGRVIFAERKGVLKIWHQDGRLVEAGRIPVSANACPECPGEPIEEGGLHGLLLDRDFDQTGLLYLFYSVPHSKDPVTNEGIFRLSRFVLRGEVLDVGSEEPIFEVPAYWPQCCHYGGDLQWMADGTILLSTGDDTIPHQSNGYAPRDKRPGWEWNDADRTSQNPLDLRGKILRLNPDGSVPADNPHVGDPAYNPYVYAMGFRSPYRISLHGPTQTVYVGPFGPGALQANPSRGPQGYDEFETVPPRGGTNHGWPHCTGDNEPFIDYDFATGTSGGPLSCEGMTPATLWYPQTPSLRWPTLGAGAGGMIAGPVYDYTGNGALALPARYRNNIMLLEWHRNAIFKVPVRADGTLDVTTSPEAFKTLTRPIDAKIGPDGALYVLEYGSSFYNSSNSRLVRITCTGCQPNPADYGLPAGTPLAGLPQGAAGALPAPAGGPSRAWIGVLALVALAVPLCRRVA
jgi:aldose sugar dehydrogenase